MQIRNGETLKIEPGSHFDILLPNGQGLQVECTADDFSMVRLDGTVAYTCPISPVAIEIDENIPVTTGTK